MGFFGGGASAMVGATASVGGSGGTVPAPAAGTENLFLKGNATFGWVFPSSTDIANTEYHGPFGAANVTGITSTSLQSTRLYLCWIIISGSKTFNRIGFRFGSAASCDARIGLYECDTTNFRPASLVVGSTALSGSTNTNVEFTISPSITLKNKIYFGCLIPSLNTSMNCSGISQMDFTNYLGGNYGNAGNQVFNRTYVDFNYAALPSDLSTYTLKLDTSTNAPVIWLRNV